MASIKISELTALTPPAAADELAVVDVSASSTKKTTVGEVVGIINGDVEVASNGTATISELPISKLQDGAARQLIQTDAAGTGVEWTSSIDLPGTLDVTGASTLDSTLSVAGVATFAAGTAGSPSLTFTGDANSGVYSPGADQVSVATGGTERLRIDSTGQIEAVSLGTAASPTYSWTGDPNSGVYSPGADQVAISTNGTGRLFVDASGNVGIGTTSPLSPFVISKSGDGIEFNPGITAFNGGVIENINRNSNTTRPDLNLFTDQGSIKFWTQGLERARIDNSGRLLVGTSSDSGGALLQVNGDRVRIATAKTPASASDTGTTGEICWDANYIYVCTATNTWKRTAIATW
jgi:hypothetical protein